MGTFLFDKVVFGPVNSRRLGISLGVNLLPVNAKYCSFNCVYCECGWTPDNINEVTLPDRKEVFDKLQTRLLIARDNGEKLDVITFAGNGEPTIHPDFHIIIEDTLFLRDKYFPGAGIVVLSNASMLHDKQVVKALKKVDKNILKLDSIHERTFNLLNQPKPGIQPEQVVKNLEKFKDSFILQIMLVKGKIGETVIDNSAPEEIDGLLGILPRVRPKSIMLYTIARETPLKGLEKIPVDKLRAIAAKFERAGYPVQIAG